MGWGKDEINLGKMQEIVKARLMGFITYFVSVGNVHNK